MSTFGMFQAPSAARVEPSFIDKTSNRKGFLLLAMDLLVVIYAICATRTNAVFFTVFLSLIVVFSLLTGSFWRLALGDTVVGMRLYKVSLVSTCYFLVVGKQQI